MERLRLGINVDRLRLSHRLERKDYEFCTMQELRRLLMYHNIKGSWNYIKPGLIQESLKLKCTLGSLPPFFLDHLLERISKACGQLYVSDIPLPISVLELFTEEQLETILSRHGYVKINDDNNVIPKEGKKLKKSAKKKLLSKQVPEILPNNIDDISNRDNIGNRDSLLHSNTDIPIEDELISLSLSSAVTPSPSETGIFENNLNNIENYHHDDTTTTTSSSSTTAPIPIFDTSQSKQKTSYTSYYSHTSSHCKPIIKSDYYHYLCSEAIHTYKIQLCHLTLEERKIINPLLQEYNEEIETTANIIETSPGEVAKLLRFLHMSRFRTSVLHYRKNRDMYMNMTAAEALKKIKSPYTIEQMEEEDKLYELPSEFLPVSDENYSTNSNTNIGPYSDTEPED